jgi:protoporphyrinogen oxidase
MKSDVVIVGGGVTGLGTALRLGLDARLYERDARLGGCLGSDFRDGYTIDRTGHLLHFTDPYVRRVMFDELAIDWITFARQAEVQIAGRRVPYPIQYHLASLAEADRARCLESFSECDGGNAAHADSFDRWCRLSYGDALFDLFFKPYNEKLWKVPLRSINAEWATRFFPAPDGDLIVRGATQTPTTNAFGYNAVFSYPASGGSQAIVDALASRASMPIQTSAALLAIDPRARMCEFANGDCVTYRSLVSTIPLPALLRCVHGVDQRVLDLAARLRNNRILYFAFGFRPGASIPPQHWIYVPEPRYVMYRVGVLSNYSPSIAPSGRVLLCVEIAFAGDADFPTELGEIRERALRDLAEIGIVDDDWVLEFEFTGQIDCAYALFDTHRATAVPKILAYLEGLGIESIGRYGRWDYSSMGDGLLEGRDCANRLNAAFGQPPTRV